MLLKVLYFTYQLNRWVNKKEDILKDIPDIMYLVPNDDYGTKKIYDREKKILNEDYKNLMDNL